MKHFQTQLFALDRKGNDFDEKVKKFLSPHSFLHGNSSGHQFKSKMLNCKNWFLYLRCDCVSLLPAKINYQRVTQST